MTNLNVRLSDIDAFVQEKLSNITDQCNIIANEKDPFDLRMIFVEVDTPLDKHKGLSASRGAFYDLMPATQSKGQPFLGFIETPVITPQSIFIHPLPDRKLDSCVRLQDTR
jgi:hypothetical protein